MTTPKGPERPLVFISHSSKDKIAASKAAYYLRELDLDVWFDDERIGLGKSIPTEISKGLSKANVILLLISKHFITSGWCRAEYEALLMKEIESGQTAVIAVRLDDADLPVLLQTRRYIDARNGLDKKTFSELAKQLNEAASWIRFQRLIPKRPHRYGESILAMIISSTLQEFPAETLIREPLRDQASMLKLFQVIDRLVENFHSLCDEILHAFLSGGVNSASNQSIYGSAFRLGLDGIRSTNRKLAKIAADMRDVAAGLDDILAEDSQARKRFSELSGVCASISVAEDFIVVLFGAPVALAKAPYDRHKGHKTDQLFGVAEYEDWDSSAWIDDYFRIAEELDAFRITLRRHIARLTSESIE